MSFSWQPIKEYMLSKPVRWYDCDGQIIFPKWQVASITTSGLAYIIEIDEINEKFFCLCTQIYPTYNHWKKIIDLVVNEFLTNKVKYELPWITLEGGSLSDSVRILYHYNEETNQDEFTIQS